MKKASEYDDAHLRVFDRPGVPEEVRSVHFIGICGTGMGSLAGLMSTAGYEIRGSDAHAYPPMSTRLGDLGIGIFDGFDTAHLVPSPDMVVVGNACTPTHAEAAFAREHGLVQMSFPEALAHFFIDGRRSLVVAGTHGKTTTTGLLVHLLNSAGRDPSFLVGGVMANGNASYGLGHGPHFVVEGDEYDSAYFDKQPKFMHYLPTCAIVTSMEFDHADIYEDFADYRTAFHSFVGTVDPRGCLVLNADLHEVMDLADSARCPVRTYAVDSPADLTAADVEISETGLSFELVSADERCAMHLPMTGTHNLGNALAAATVALHEGLSVDEIAQGLATFRGLKRRQEILGVVNDVVVVDDFAHHPTAVSETISAIRQRFPDRRLVAIFEPRSNSSRRKVFERPYIESFENAHRVFISAPPFRHNDVRSDFMDAAVIARELDRQGVETDAIEGNGALRNALSHEIRPGDVALIMSNGGFDGIHSWLLDKLAQDAPSPGDPAG